MSNQIIEHKQIASRHGVQKDDKIWMKSEQMTTSNSWEQEE